VLGTLLETGWAVQAGGRSLFFNPELTKAWTADLSVSYNYNHAHPQHIELPVGAANGIGGVVLLPTPVTLRQLHRTFANAAGGREWYLSGTANCPGFSWRAGFDVGGRLGTAKAEFAEITHRTDTIYGFDIALHTDIERPFGFCTLFGGFRAEWDMTWMDIISPFNNSNLEDINLLVNFGIRF
jgi:hypothetical protein